MNIANHRARIIIKKAQSTSAALMMNSHGHFYKTHPRNILVFYFYHMNLFLSTSHLLWLIKQKRPFLLRQSNIAQIFAISRRHTAINSLSILSSKTDWSLFAKRFHFSQLEPFCNPPPSAFIHHRRSTDFVYFVAEAAFIVLRLENNKRYCYICDEHTLTSHRTFIREAVRCGLLHLPEGWWAFVYLPPSVSNTVFFFFFPLLVHSQTALRGITKHSAAPARRRCTSTATTRLIISPG